MNQLNLVKIEVFEFLYCKPEVLFTLTDGQGKYLLSNDGAVWFTDEKNIYSHYERGPDGFPHKESVELNVVKFNNKYLVMNLDLMKEISNSYDTIDDLLKAIYEEGILGSKIKHLDFDNDLYC